MDVFTQRMTIVYDHLGANEPQQALNELNSLINKKKSLAKLTDKQKALLSLVKSSCLARLNSYGEALALLQQFKAEYGPWDKDAQQYSRMLISVAIYLHAAQEVRVYYEPYFKANSSDEKVAGDYLLLCLALWDLGTAQQHYMKAFKQTEKGLDYLASVSVQYLSLRKVQDGYLDSPEPSKLKIFNLFLPKLSTHIEAEKDEDLRRKLKSQLVLFKYHLLKDIGDIEAVLKHIDSNRPLFEFSFHLDALAELCEKQDVWEVHSSQIQTIFFQILEDQLMENSVANYNMQRRYMLAMLARTDRSQRADVLQALNSHKCATIENFVDFFQGIKPEQFLMVYLKMLSRYIKKYVTDQKDKFCSKNYLILCMDIFKALLVESTEEEKAALRPLVKDFVDRSVLFYKNTLTLADELRHLYLDDSYFRKLIVSAMDQILSKSDDQGMKCTLQYQRMLVGLVDVDLCARDDQACIDTVNDFLASFDMFEDAFYKDMKKIDVAKGDRLTNDNYLFAACEILRILQDRQNSPSASFKYRIAALAILEFAKRSPYNFDLMLRNLEIIERLALYDENHEMFLKHDIKGNQFDTLSSRFYGTASLGVVGDQAWKWNSPALGYFRECEKEVLESFKNCCKHGNLGVLWEFYLYERLCNNSVQRVVTYNVLADQLIHSYDKKLGTPDTNMVNAEWFLDANFEKLFKNKAKLAFNFDLVQIQIPEYFTKKLFNFDLIGPQKDIHLLRVNCLLNRSLVKLALGKHTELEKETLWSIRAEIDLIKKDNLRSFEDYYVYRRVNNPVARPETLKDKKIYGELTISHQMKTIRLGVEALYEFVRVCYTFSTPIPEPDLLDVATLAGQKLQELKETIAASIKSMILADLPGYDEESHFRVMHLMRVLLNIWSSYSRLSTDLKANSKKYAKSRPDTEKESISKCLTGYSTLKDSIKDLAKQIEDVLEIAVSVKSYTLKSDLLQETGIKWPRVIESALSKVTSTYSSMFQNSIIDIQTKMSMLRKSLN